MRMPIICVAYASLFLGGCVVTPSTDDPTATYASNASVHFQGFASKPGATVELYAYDQYALQYRLIATTTAVTGPITYGGRNIYVWNIHHQLNTASGYQAFYPPPSLGGFVHYQVREVGGSFPKLLTFEPGGLTCTTQRVGAGEDLYTAAWACKAVRFDEIVLYYPFQ